MKTLQGVLSFNSALIIQQFLNVVVGVHFLGRNGAFLEVVQNFGRYGIARRKK
jgi:hypothetical protein